MGPLHGVSSSYTALATLPSKLVKVEGKRQFSVEETANRVPSFFLFFYLSQIQSLNNRKGSLNYVSWKNLDFIYIFTR